MTEHPPVETSQTPNNDHVAPTPKSGLETFLAKHRRSLVLIGAVIMLVTYFVRDVIDENTKERLADMKAGAALYLSNPRSSQGELNELQKTSQILQGDANSISRPTAFASILNGCVGVQQDVIRLSIFGRSMIPEAPPTTLTEVSDIIGRLQTTCDSAQLFLKNSPVDSNSFKEGARSLVVQLIKIENDISVAEPKLLLLEQEQEETLNGKSSLHRLVVTILYCLGLALTVIAALYKIDVPQ
jgi:hypothetical protein